MSSVNPNPPSKVDEEPFDYASNSQIKNIFLQIPGGYRYRHQSLENDEGFLGRKQIIDSFQDILSSESRKGVYLVTGYRGMGKTSFVKQVIGRLKDKKSIDNLNAKGWLGKFWGTTFRVKEDSKIREFYISLAQSQLKDIDILKHIVNQIITGLENTQQYHIARWSSLVNVFGWLWPLITILLIGTNFFLVSANNTDNSKTVIENLIGIAVLSAILAMFLHKIISWSSTKLASLKPGIKAGAIATMLGLAGAAVYVINNVLPDFFGNSEWILKNYKKGGIPDLNPVLSFQGLSIIVATALLILLMLKLLSKIPVFVDKKVPIARIHEKLKTLQDRCNAQITKEDQLQESFALSLSSLFNKHQKVYPIANPREIENELIQIIDDLKKHYQYIFVFDELDKVDPNFDNVTDHVATGKDDNAGKVTYLNDLRERRHLITNILASLKYFINEAEAKFIFIAGREMFEAALADISDRQSSISSIFHKVIYVDSFLKDRTDSENQVAAIGGLVETFLRSILLKNHTQQNDFFTQYYKYLTDENYSADKEKENTPDKIPDKERILKTKEARKIIFTLQNFLGYLVYRSNGSPKKITKLFEEYVKEVDFEEYLKERDYRFYPAEMSKSIVYTSHSNEKRRHYLHFSYLDQYKLGYTAYLFQPFLTMNSSFMKRYSDNTLVSISYLIDNLIKFHPFAFSAQNLELLPEILATSRTPISRPFLEDLVSFLAQNHIRKTESGLYEYKFYDRTHNEITFISKLFEDEAAAFNFTLDETFSIKTHLQAKIRHLRTAHNGSNATSPIISIVFLNRLLGDVRFQDEEYQDAIVSYQDALQMFTQSPIQQPNQIISFILLKLKLGLTYEKIKAYEYALGHYAGVIEKGCELLKSKNSERQLIYRELLGLIMQAFLATLYLQEKLQEGLTFQKIKHNVNLFFRLLGGFTHDYENRDMLMSSFYSGIGTALYFKNMVLPQQVNVDRRSANNDAKKVQDAFDNTRSCFSSHIDSELISVSEKEINVLRNPRAVNTDTRLSLSAYIYYKSAIKTLIGTGKNGLPEILRASWKMISPIAEDEPTYRSLQHTRRLSNLGHALAKMGDYLLPIVKTESIRVIDAIGCFYFPKGEESKKDQIFESRNRFYVEYLNKVNVMKKDFDHGLHPRFLIHLYYLSALFYLEAGDRSNAVFQLRKIIHVLRVVKLKSDPQTSVYSVLLCLESNVIRRILELSSLMSHSSDRPQLTKFKRYFDINTYRTPHDYSNELYANLSNNPDTKETILAYALLKIKYLKMPTKLNSCVFQSLKTYFREIPEHKLLSPYNSISHQITRLMELELHTRINYHILNNYLSELINLQYTVNDQGSGQTYLFQLFGKDSHWENDYFHASKLYDLKKPGTFHPSARPENEARIKNLITKLKKSLDKCNWFDDYLDIVVNSVFNLTQMKRTLDTFGHNYILSYAFLAKVHQDLGMWLKHLHLCYIIANERGLGNKVERKLHDLLGYQDSITLDALTESQMAVQFYYLAIQMHKEGSIYRNRMNNLIYLEDDFNDNLYHFGAALERQKISSGTVRKAIKYLKADLHKANMYKYSTFIGHA
ncbi:hypothetical protein SAMN04487996_10623 [Dyadobacter soli]|uniref:AAA ATPase domain-containing protein n=1 Tax=Dyadobacter soli TaxID=659014 RepID=A0A1G7ECH3_9BACT|nr:ATP-binding protein [Dyadobacter soli]SDE61342.1 hypothetical protein SAMN04487996_10623 [Dyadobacter soli]